MQYESNQEYNIECCQPGGTYELNCWDSYGDGWNGGSIEIGGTQYCGDFWGYSHEQMVQHSSLIALGGNP